MFTGKSLIYLELKNTLVRKLNCNYLLHYLLYSIIFLEETTHSILSVAIPPYSDAKNSSYYFHFNRSKCLIINSIFFSEAETDYCEIQFSVEYTYFLRNYTYKPLISMKSQIFRRGDFSHQVNQRI